MQRGASIMLALSSILLIGISAYAADKTLTDYQSLFEGKMSKVDKVYRASQNTALQSYRKKIAIAKETLQSQGDLDGTIAVNREIKRLEREKTVPQELPDEFPTRLVLAHKNYHAVLLAAEQTKNKTTAGLIKRYLVPLERLQKQLVRKNALDEALAVNKEIKKVQVVLADIESKMPAADPTKSINPTTRSRGRSLSLRKGLVLNYSFDKNEGKKVTDSSGKRNNGNALNAKWTADGRLNGAYQFAGQGQHIETKGHQSLDLAGEMSITAWVKASQMTGTPAICAKGNGGGGESWLVDIDRNKFRYVRRQHDGASYVQAISAQKVQLGVWYHVVGVADGKQLRIYVNAKETIGQAYSGPFDTNKHKVSIGSRQGGQRAYDLSFIGVIDEVMIFNRPLSEEEIRQLFNERK